MGGPGRPQGSLKGETEQANALADFLRELTGGATVRQLGERYRTGKTSWGEYRSGVKIIPLHLLERIIHDQVRDPRPRAALLAKARCLHDEAEAAGRGPHSTLGTRPSARRGPHAPTGPERSPAGPGKSAAGPGKSAAGPGKSAAGSAKSARPVPSGRSTGRDRTDVPADQSPPGPGVVREKPTGPADNPGDNGGVSGSGAGDTRAGAGGIDAGAGVNGVGAGARADAGSAGTGAGAGGDAAGTDHRESFAGRRPMLRVLLLAAGSALAVAAGVLVTACRRPRRSP
ncbi:hypothetical protein Aros01_00686 [Streptosporangium roseum]|uniref:Uncharacterized protein n=1 Tax=Streptosporangium roseum (strain ATCC 12428 / DSM 43021 / JCM 3005 / KCTC 9067 / NCIMB 10171 / NRRL 2505 / NI 9100) TaxID=479432 RepID=D2ASZ6_STRRD|nr:hypothetical protein Sros_7807 [Streptosporangium roseum DSM 43021]